MRFGRSEVPFLKIIDAPFAEGKPKRLVNGCSSHDSTPVLVESLALEKQVARDFAFFGRECVAGIVAGVRLGKEIGAVYFDTLMSVILDRAFVTLPFRIMMRDVAELIFWKVTEIFPRER